MAEGLLDKANIILTPTGYKAGTMYNVAPIEQPYEDFDFARASVASRVNSSGLVEMVGRTLGSNLVQNGDFSEIGPELVTNGSFDTDSGWSKDTGWSIANGIASYDGTGGTSAIYQSNVIEVGKTYKITIQVTSNEGTGANTIYLGNTILNSSHLSVGTHTFYGATSSASLALIIYGRSGEVFEIDNVSVKELDPNNYWSTTSTVTVKDGFANITSDGSYQYLRQLNIVEVGKSYKLTYEITRQGSGVLKSSSLGLNSIPSTVGTHTVYGLSSQTYIVIDRASACDIDITNIVVQEIIDTNNIPRINYDSNGENGHWLLEPTSTNLLPYSEDFTTWTVSSGLSLTDNSIISPSGLNDGWKVESDGTSGFSALRYAVSISGDNTFSVYAKQGTNRYITLRSLSGVDARANFDLQEGTSTSSNATSIIEDVGNGWYRCSMSFTGTNANVYIYPNEIGTANSGYIYLQFAQLEALSYATSYIPTLTGSTETRATETANGAGSADLINSTEGVLYAEIAALSTTDASGNISLSDGTGNNRIYIYYLVDNSISVIYNINSTGAAIHNFALADITQQTKIAVKWGDSNVSVWINGSSVLSAATSNFLPNTLNQLSFSKPSGSVPFEGKVKQLQVYKTALTDTELAALTS